MADNDDREDTPDDPTLEGEIQAPGRSVATAYPVSLDELVPRQGVIRTLWWQSVRFESFRKAAESYERALRAASAALLAEADMQNAQTELRIALDYLGDMEEILESDRRVRQNRRDLVERQAERALLEEELALARVQKKVSDIQAGRKQAQKQKKDEDDPVALFEEIIKLRDNLQQRLAEQVESTLRAHGVESENDLPPDVRRGVQNMRDLANQLISRKLGGEEE